MNNNGNYLKTTFIYTQSGEMIHEKRPMKTDEIKKAYPSAMSAEIAVLDRDNPGKGYFQIIKLF